MSKPIEIKLEKIPSADKAVESEAPADIQGAMLYKEGLSVAERMAQQLTFKPSQPKDSPLIALIKKIPFYETLLGSLESEGKHIGDFISTEGVLTESLGNAQTAFGISEIFLNGINFLRIPALYLAAALLGEKPPITLSKNAKWAYAGIMLGFTIAAFAAAPAAAIIGIAGASLGLTVSLYTLGRTLYKRYQLKQDQASLEQTIVEETMGLNELHQKAIELEGQLQNAKGIQNTQEAARLYSELGEVKHRFDELFQNKRDRLQALHDKKAACDSKLVKKGTATIVDKSVGLALSAMALTGLVLSLFFPPVGAGLMLAAATLGTAYIIGRLLLPKIAPFFQWIASQFVNKNAAKLPDKPDEESKIQQTVENTAENTLSKVAYQSLISDVPSPTESTSTIIEPASPKDSTPHVIKPPAPKTNAHTSGANSFFTPKKSAPTDADENDKSDQLKP